MATLGLREQTLFRFEDVIKKLENSSATMSLEMKQNAGLYLVVQERPFEMFPEMCTWVNVNSYTQIKEKTNGKYVVMPTFKSGVQPILHYKDLESMGLVYLVVAPATAHDVEVKRVAPNCDLTMAYNIKPLIRTL